MANPEHLAILKQGVREWNQWRIWNPDVAPDLSGAELTDCALVQYDLHNSILAQTLLIRATLIGANLSNAILNNANLSGAILYGANLQNADLTATDLSAATLMESDLTGADLRLSFASQANFGGAKLINAKLRKAVILGVNFSGSDLNGVDFTEAQMGFTTFGNNDLGLVSGLDSVLHFAPSTIGIDTIYRSNGNIPEAFLKEAGVPETFIVFTRSLVVNTTDFYSCFISFTEMDNVFAESLYKDLVSSGVRCWRWKEDAKWGRNLMKSIDEAVSDYEKLVVICSESSLNSPAVNREIERALQKEDDLIRQGKEGEVLFPIRLDDYIFAGWADRRKADVINKNVGDFRQWQNPDHYRQALERLIRDLKSD